MRADRLLMLTALLRQRGRMSAPELARRLEVTERTVLRDIEALSAAGVPVYTERGRHGGFSLLPGYAPDPTELTAADANALFLSGGARTLDTLGLAAPLQSALRKLAASLPAGMDTEVSRRSARVVVDAAGWSAAGTDLAELEVTQQAVFTDRRLRFRYAPRAPAQPGIRTVDPYGLLLAGQVWYLIAAHRGRPRSYRVSRMAEARVLDQPSSRPPDLELRELWQQMRERYVTGHEVPVRLRTPNRRVELVLSFLAPQLAGPPVLHPGPETTVIEAQAQTVRGTAAVLAGFAGQVEILDPLELREVLRGIGQELSALYADPPAPEPAEPAEPPTMRSSSPRSTDRSVGPSMTCG